MLSGADRPGRSPIRTTTQSARSALATASPIATRPWRTTTSGAILKPCARSSGRTPASTGAAWLCTARADRPPVTTNTTSWSAACGCERGLGARARDGGRGPDASDSFAGPVRRWRSRRPDMSSPARSAISRASSSGSCTASRARAWASWKSSSGPVASDAPVRCSPMRAAVSRRNATQTPSSPGAGGGARSGRAVSSSAIGFKPAAARGSGSAWCADGCGSRHPSGPAVPARSRIPAPGGGRAGRAWRARRGTRCSDSPA